MPFVIVATTDDAQQRALQSLPRETSRCYRLFGRSATARESWLQQPAFLGILNHFLRTKTVPYNDNGSTVLETDAILSAAATLDIGPGVKAQDLHRDDFIWQQTHKAKGGEGYQMGSDFSMGLLVPGVNTTKANGATLVEDFLSRLSPHADGAQFVPGSHLWDHSRRPKTEDVVAAEMNVGEAFLFLGSTVHAGGANTTSQSRPMHAFFYCRSWMRPEVRTLHFLHFAAGLLYSMHFLFTARLRRTDETTGESTPVVDEGRGSAMVSSGPEASRICAR